jgi:hypothetical protein
VATRDGIFPTFFLSGFECSSFLWGKERVRRDLNAELQHYAHADEDYRLLASIGIAVAREGIAWPHVDRGGGAYDFSAIEPFLDAQRRHAILPIWDLCHYGYPDDLDPLGDVDGFVARFTAYARAAATTAPCASRPSTSRPSGAIWAASGAGARRGARARRNAAASPARSPAPTSPPAGRSAWIFPTPASSTSTR